MPWQTRSKCDLKFRKKWAVTIVRGTDKPIVEMAREPGIGRRPRESPRESTAQNRQERGKPVGRQTRREQLRRTGRVAADDSGYLEGLVRVNRVGVQANRSASCTVVSSRTAPDLDPLPHAADKPAWPGRWTCETPRSVCHFVCPIAADWADERPNGRKPTAGDLARWVGARQTTAREPASNPKVARSKRAGGAPTELVFRGGS
jgi:hypothetical protein